MAPNLGAIVNARAMAEKPRTLRNKNNINVELTKFPQNAKIKGTSPRQCLTISITINPKTSVTMINYKLLQDEDMSYKSK